ncbi:hypothetical protein M271_02245 [Streptomyces rapamycinicus NRRL 5491]|nr:hypothetical protein M271_02245 [Streptomyces rapamycinicus NRRL 5491]
MRHVVGARTTLPDRTVVVPPLPHLSPWSGLTITESRPGTNTEVHPDTGQPPAHASTLVRLPDNVSTVHAAVATDSVVTAYHAVRTEAQAKPGEVIAVIGLGGLGLNGVRTGVIAGATVYGVDINPGTFAAAHAAGARECFTDTAALADLRTGSATARSAAACSPAPAADPGLLGVHALRQLSGDGRAVRVPTPDRGWCASGLPR